MEERIQGHGRIALDKLLALRDKATGGPWVASADVHCINHSKVTHYPNEHRYDRICNALTTDAEFICAIHDAVEMLVAVNEEVAPLLDPDYAPTGEDGRHLIRRLGAILRGEA